MSGLGGYFGVLSQVTAMLVLAVACGGQTELAPGAPAGTSTAPDGGLEAGDGDGDGADSERIESCQPLPDRRVLLASGLRLPYFVAAPRAADDPVVVSYYEQEQRYYRFIDPRTCRVRATWKPGTERVPIALGDWIVGRDPQDVWLLNLITNQEMRAMMRGVPIAVHPDAQWLYVVSAFVEEDWAIAKNETVREAFVQRVPRSALSRIQEPELVATIDLSELMLWNRIAVSSSPSQLLLQFAYGQLDVSGPYALIQLRLDTLTELVIFRDATPTNAIAWGNDALVQKSNELLLYSGGQAPRLLRNDLDHLSLRGAIGEYAIAADGWFDRKLLALPLAGGAARELSSDVTTSEAVSTADGRVYWATSAGELWMMTP